VKIKPIIACRLALTIIAWCAQVTVAPELNKKNVLVNGIPDFGSFELLLEVKHHLT
jgi:hypothetical protein